MSRSTPRWPDTRLGSLLSVRHPLFQAPMAGVSTPALAAAVSNAGGVGALGAALWSPEQVRLKVAEFRELSRGPLHLNFFAHQSNGPREPGHKLVRLLEGYYRELGLGALPPLRAPVQPFGPEMLDVVLELGPELVSFHFGIPEPRVLAALRDGGSRVAATATSVAEARLLEDAGVDFVIAQGFEAGGHSGAFAATDAEPIGTLALVPQVVDAVRCPVVAAGGIADGRGIAAALLLGASGAQLGTAFLGCPETGLDTEYRAAVLGASPARTVLTRALSGCPARALENRFTRDTAALGHEAASFPEQLALTLPLRRASGADFGAFWAGQAVALTRPRPAGELTAALADAALALLEGTGRRIAGNP